MSRLRTFGSYMIKYDQTEGGCLWLNAVIATKMVTMNTNVTKCCANKAQPYKRDVMIQ